jgi:hypothetical protein
MLVGLVDEEQVADFDQNKRHEILIKVEFLLADRLVAKVRSGDFLVMNDASFCERPEVNARLSYPSVYWTGTRVGSAAHRRLLTLGSPAVAQPHYLFLATSRPERPAKPPEEPFDLRQQPEDVCVRLIGSTPLGFGWFRSDVLRIPAAAIVDVLHES